MRGLRAEQINKETFAKFCRVQSRSYFTVTVVEFVRFMIIDGYTIPWIPLCEFNNMFRHLKVLFQCVPICQYKCIVPRYVAQDNRCKANLFQCVRVCESKCTIPHTLCASVLVATFL